MIKFAKRLVGHDGFHGWLLHTFWHCWCLADWSFTNIVGWCGDWKFGFEWIPEVADLSPIQFGKQPATDGTKPGSKYWWNQGLAAWFRAKSTTLLPIPVPGTAMTSRNFDSNKSGNGNVEPTESFEKPRKWTCRPPKKGTISKGTVYLPTIDLYEID